MGQSHGAALTAAFLFAACSNAAAQLPTAPENTWMGLEVRPEGPRSGYDRSDFGYAYESLEDETIAGLPRSGGQVYTPYSCALYDIRADGTAATDIDHIVALAEAYDSGLAAERRRDFGGDILNLTIAAPSVNRQQKSANDDAEWMPTHNRGWYAARVVAVKRKYGLSSTRPSATRYRRRWTPSRSAWWSAERSPNDPLRV